MTRAVLQRGRHGPRFLICVAIVAACVACALSGVAAEPVNDNSELVPCIEGNAFAQQFAPLVVATTSPEAVVHSTSKQRPGFCFRQTAAWWTYDVCWNRYLRQFHEEQGTVLAEFILGTGVDVNVADNILATTRQYVDGTYSLQRKVDALDFAARTGGLQRAERSFRCSATAGSTTQWETPVVVTAHWQDGAVCDATGLPRRTKIVGVCDPLARVTDLLYSDVTHVVGFNVTETSPCEYTVFYYGRLVCDAMGRRKPVAGEPFKPQQEQQQQQPQQQQQQQQNPQSAPQSKTATGDVDGIIRPTHYASPKATKPLEEPVAKAPVAEVPAANAPIPKNVAVVPPAAEIPAPNPIPHPPSPSPPPPPPPDVQGGLDNPLSIYDGDDMFVLSVV